MKSGIHVAVAAGAFVARLSLADPFTAGSPSAPAAETLALPGAANTLGTHGARWRSDLSIRNPGNDPIEVRVLFLRAGQPNDVASAPHKDFFLISGEVKEIRNVLGAEIGVTGTGVLIVSASRLVFPNNPAGASVSAVMRTASPLLLAPGDSGSGISPAEPTDAARQAVALRHDGVGEKGLRGAVGAVNLSRKDWLKLRVEYVDKDGEVLAEKELHLPPLSSAQQASPVRLAKGSARLTRIEGAGPFIAYATTVDNSAGDATFTYATPEPGQPAAVRPLSFGALAE